MVPLKIPLFSIFEFLCVKYQAFTSDKLNTDVPKDTTFDSDTSEFKLFKLNKTL